MYNAYKRNAETSISQCKTQIDLRDNYNFVSRSYIKNKGIFITGIALVFGILGGAGYFIMKNNKN
jgi:hypothetical protein